MLGSGRLRRALLVFALLLACDRDSEWYGTTKPKRPPNELWVNNGGEPEWIDPGKASDGIASTLVENMFEGLTAPEMADVPPLYAPVPPSGR